MEKDVKGGVCGPNCLACRRLEEAALAGVGNEDDFTIEVDGSMLKWGPIDGPHKVWFTITPSGDVVLGPHIEWTDAAQAFWREVERLAPDGRRLIRP